jgi:hypothetical protein
MFKMISMVAGAACSMWGCICSIVFAINIECSSILMLICR